MKELKKAIKKANDYFTKSEGFCGEIIIGAFDKYQKTRDDETEDIFIYDIGCFIQAGDGLVFTDGNGSNVPVSFIVGIIEDKGYFTYDDFMNSRV